MEAREEKNQMNESSASLVDRGITQSASMLFPAECGFRRCSRWLELFWDNK